MSEKRKENGIEREVKEFEGENALHLIKVKRIIRNPAGDWTLILDVNNAFEIDADRYALFHAEVRVKGRQFGRKKRKDSIRK
jgi:hypothetical protein